MMAVVEKPVVSATVADVGLAGLYAQLSGDLELISLTGAKASGRARVVPDWPTDTMQASDFPRATYILVSDQSFGRGAGLARIQVDIWVWPTQTEALGKIDARIESLLDMRRWRLSDWRLGGEFECTGRLLPGGQNVPAGVGRPLRRRRDYEIRVSPA